MTNKRLNEIQVASIFIISGLFLCLTWRFVPDDSMYTFPFIAITFPLKDFVTLFTESFSGVYLLPSALIAGNMSFPVNIRLRLTHLTMKGFSLFTFHKVFNYNIWAGIILFELAKQIDLILFYRQTPFRAPSILLLIMIQVYYLYCSSKDQ